MAAFLNTHIPGAHRYDTKTILYSEPLNEREAKQRVCKMVRLIQDDAGLQIRKIESEFQEEFFRTVVSQVPLKIQEIDEKYDEMTRECVNKGKRIKFHLEEEALVQLHWEKHKLLLETWAECKRRMARVLSPTFATVYKRLMLGLITQGLFKMVMRQVNVYVRKEDTELIEENLDKVVQKYERATKSTVEIRVLEIPDSWRSEFEVSGVVLMDPTGIIMVKNTLLGRLEMICQNSTSLAQSVLFTGYGPQKMCHVCDRNSVVLFRTRGSMRQSRVIQMDHSVSLTSYRAYRRQFDKESKRRYRLESMNMLSHYGKLGYGLDELEELDRIIHPKD